VKCILTKPSKLPAGKYPGAKTRYDDFVVVHMNMTPSVHGTANFMHWHRYYIWYDRTSDYLLKTDQANETTGLTRRPYGQNATTKDTNLTGTGPSTKTYPRRLYSTATNGAWVAMENQFRTKVDSSDVRYLLVLVAVA
jgi:hypothetical protein